MDRTSVFNYILRGVAFTRAYIQNKINDTIEQLCLYIIKKCNICITVNINMYINLASNYIIIKLKLILFLGSVNTVPEQNGFVFNNLI